MPPSSTATIKPSGHVKEDLVELMMIQNAQMHQVIMNNMTMSALGSFGYPGPSPGPEAPRAQVMIPENEPDPQVYHHYYQPALYLPHPAWLQPQATADRRGDSTSSPPQHRDRPAVPAPCPPNANVAPAAESNGASEAEEAEKRSG
ncbi:proline-rich protein 29-like [Mugil cephalus]|uniref:proline-rich protein 29-like n=1 Tax=Mugil cephalus TaxID=48193 RepID=UPI001FB5A803|nr:proline-rich protein 29-like [Mugil cephalus]